MIEAEQIHCTHLLDDPVEAVVRFSHDPALQAKALLTSGEELTAVDLLRYFLDDMTAFVERGGCDGYVPLAREIMELANDTVQKLAVRDFESVLGRVEWLLKQQVLERTLAKHAHLNWQSPEIKHLDHLYSSLDPAEGLYWIYERSQVVETLVTPGEIERFVHAPPDDTRAYARAMLLRRADPEQVRFVDWDRIHFRFDQPGSWQSRYRTLDMSDPLGFTRAQTEHIFQDPQADLQRMVEALGAGETESSLGLGASTMQQQLFYDSN
jgi:proteasome accessory factor A